MSDDSADIKISYIAAARLKVAIAARKHEEVPGWIHRLAARDLTVDRPSRGPAVPPEPVVSSQGEADQPGDPQPSGPSRTRPAPAVERPVPTARPVPATPPGPVPTARPLPTARPVPATPPRPAQPPGRRPITPQPPPGDDRGGPPRSGDPSQTGPRTGPAEETPRRGPARHPAQKPPGSPKGPGDTRGGGPAR